MQRSLIHQKIMVIDGVWAHVGSTNFDSRSFDINEEAGVGIIDAAVAAQLKEAFEDDMKDCVELTPARAPAGAQRDTASRATTRAPNPSNPARRHLR